MTEREKSIPELIRDAQQLQSAKNEFADLSEKLGTNQGPDLFNPKKISGGLPEITRVGRSVGRIRLLLRQQVVPYFAERVEKTEGVLYDKAKEKAEADINEVRTQVEEGNLPQEFLEAAENARDNVLRDFRRGLITTEEVIHRLIGDQETESKIAPITLTPEVSSVDSNDASSLEPDSSEEVQEEENLPDMPLLELNEEDYSISLNGVLLNRTTKEQYEILRILSERWEEKVLSSELRRSIFGPSISPQQADLKGRVDSLRSRFIKMGYPDILTVVKASSQSGYILSGVRLPQPEVDINETHDQDAQINPEDLNILVDLFEPDVLDSEELIEESAADPELTPEQIRNFQLDALAVFARNPQISEPELLGIFSGRSHMSVTSLEMAAMLVGLARELYTLRNSDSIKKKEKEIWDAIKTSSQQDNDGAVLQEVMTNLSQWMRLIRNVASSGHHRLGPQTPAARPTLDTPRTGEDNSQGQNDGSNKKRASFGVSRAELTKIHELRMPDGSIYPLSGVVKLKIAETLLKYVDQGKTCAELAVEIYPGDPDGAKKVSSHISLFRKDKNLGNINWEVDTSKKRDKETLVALRKKTNGSLIPNGAQIVPVEQSSNNEPVPIQVVESTEVSPKSIIPEEEINTVAELIVRWAERSSFASLIPNELREQAKTLLAKRDANLASRLDDPEYIAYALDRVKFLIDQSEEAIRLNEQIASANVEAISFLTWLDLRANEVGAQVMFDSLMVDPEDIPANIRQQLRDINGVENTKTPSVRQKVEAYVQRCYEYVQVHHVPRDLSGRRVDRFSHMEEGFATVTETYRNRMNKWVQPARKEGNLPYYDHSRFMMLIFLRNFEGQIDDDIVEMAETAINNILTQPED